MSMDVKKRGFKVALVIILLLIIISLISAEEAPPSDAEAVPATESVGLQEAGRVAEMYITFDDLGGCDDDSEAIDEVRSTYEGCELPTTEGCQVRSLETAWDNDAGCALMVPGLIITQNSQENLFCGDFQQYPNEEYGDGTFLLVEGGKQCTHLLSGDLAENLWCKDIRVLDNNQYLCDSENSWRICSLEAEGFVAWVDDILYTCTIGDNNLPKWEKITGEDLDHDAVPSNLDCADNPADDPAGCPTDLTVETCSYPQQSRCAICIHPNAPETCGDGKDNDCRAETSDDCNLFQAGCEQTSEADINGVAIDTATLEQSQIHYNVQGELFSWIGEGNDGLCCGFKGVENLGSTTEISSGEYVCLSDDPNLVGVRDGSASEIGATWSACEGKWCWVSASLDAKFQVYTIKKLQQEPYDIVSNSESWFACQANSEKYLSTPLFAGDNIDQTDDGFIEDDYIKRANRFACYSEGNHWSWAECYGTNRPTANENTIKGRMVGEGLYTLYLADRTDDNPEGIISGSRIELNTEKGQFQNFYEYDSFDFSGYTNLEFFVRFADEAGNPITEDHTEDLHLPANVIVEIYGPDQPDGSRTLYFSQPVLGYLTNVPSFKGENWMHIKIPIDNTLKGIRQVVIKSVPSTNFISVKNVYLSSEETTEFCSGQSTTDRSSWITDLDEGDSDSQITAEKLCQAHFSDQAWLGNDDEVDDTTANCCGNTPQEYYAGESRVVEPDSKSYGCWNSLPIASGNEVTNIQYDVSEYTLSSITVEYPVKEFGLKKRTRVITYEEVVCEDASDIGYEVKCANKEEYDNWQSGSGEEPSYSYHNSVDETQTNIEDILIGDDEGYINRVYLLQSTEEYIKVQSNEEENLFSTEISLLSSPLIVDTLILSKSDLNNLNQQPMGRITLSFLASYSEPITDVYFVDSQNPSDDLGMELTTSELPLQPREFYIMAKVNENYAVEVTNTDEINSESFNYPCQPNEKGECLYPLPGLPPYTITNPHPYSYELYFVGKDDDGNDIETLITNPTGQKFNFLGNIKAKKVAQPVLYVNEGPDSEEIPGFYGCQAPEYVDSELTENLEYCSIKTTKFCSPSVVQETGPGSRERYTITNTWDDTGITQVGYQELESLPAGSITELYSNPELLPLKAETIPAEERNNFTTVLPSRNFIPNADFKLYGTALPHWEISLTEGDVRSRITEGKLTLQEGETLRSEFIAVPSDTTLHFTATESCSPSITLVNKDGNAEPFTENLEEINTGTYSFAIITFTGPCNVEKPLLQTVDDLDPVPYEQAQRTPLDLGMDTGEKTFRSGAACCPTGYCWNGYVCVEPMGPFTYLSEHIDEGRDYRCVNGEWSYQPVKLDWQAEQWGFCEDAEQCFVSSSAAAVSDVENTAADFYQGNDPTCINNGEFIFDNYCQEGNWSSRTKFIATKLLEVAEHDDNYVLYCTDYRQALINTENQGDKQLYIGGEFSVGEQGTLDLGSAIAGTPTPGIMQTCYGQGTGGLSATGQGLVSDQENTCINKVCVLIPEDGKVAFATSLNKPLDDADSFLYALNLPQDSLSEICAGSGDFTECDLSDLDLPGSLWYSAKLNALIYSRDGIELNPTIIDAILNWFKDVFGIESELSEESEFITQAQKFNQLYLLSRDGRTIRAVQEVFSNDKQTLIAEYENFETPICDYVVETLELPVDLQTELLEDVVGRDQLSCTSDNTLQRIELVGGLDFFWPQLTGRLRVE